METKTTQPFTGEGKFSTNIRSVIGSLVSRLNQRCVSPSFTVYCFILIEQSDTLMVYTLNNKNV